MYDRPELTAEHDRYWSAIRLELAALDIAGPATLSRDIEDLFEHWRAPDLVLSQTCGMPYRVALHSDVTLVGTPDHGVEGCPPGYYRSVIVVRSDDRRTTLDQFASGCLAFNETMSQSGYNAPKVHLEPMGFWFAEEVETGGHIASAMFVETGSADIASLDAVTWRLMQRHDPTSAGLRVLEVTDPTPGLPNIASAGVDGGRVFEGVARAIENLSPEDRQALGIRGLVAIPTDDYLAVTTPSS